MSSSSSSSRLPPSAESLLDSIKARRSYYKLGNGKGGDTSPSSSVTDGDLIQVITEVVKQTPSAFNSQTSRVIFLLGEDHTSYWTDILPSGLKATSPPDVYKSQEPRLRSFAAAKGTILFFEDLAAVSDLGHRTPFIKHFTRDWSLQSSGMLQVNLWNLITNLGYGANLQHVGPMVGQTVEDEIKRRWLGVDKDAAEWKLNAELVFGCREGEPKEKTFVDKQRVFAFGHGNEQ